MAVLFLSILLFIMCAGFLSTKSHEAKVGYLAGESFQARELAYSGLETARVKLLNDANFPPASMSVSHEVFSYTEVLEGLDPDDEIGRYHLHCDRRWVDPPYFVLRVTSIGQVGDDDGNPIRHKLVGEFDMTPGQRGTLLNFVDQGAY